MHTYISTVTGGLSIKLWQWLSSYIQWTCRVNSLQWICLKVVGEMLVPTKLTHMVFAIASVALLHSAKFSTFLPSFFHYWQTSQSRNWTACVCYTTFGIPPLAALLTDTCSWLHLAVSPLWHMTYIVAALPLLLRTLSCFRTLCMLDQWECLWPLVSLLTKLCVFGQFMYNLNRLLTRYCF